MGRLYENPPIVEAVCEFHFEPSQPWDWTVPGLVYDKIKDEFPKKHQRNIVEVEMHAEQQQVAQRVKGGVAQMQFLRDDERALIQVGPDLLTVNHLKPYPKWGIYQAMIIHALQVYRQVANPKGLKRIGLRYINRIQVPEPIFEIEDYLLAVPSVPQSVPQAFRVFIQRVEIPFERVNGLLILQSALGVPEESESAKSALMLDLDFVTLDATSVTLDAAMEWVGQAHDEVENTFEACITPKARALFKEVAQ
jgi:uncharacterized protein (TIGR04255 family)